VPGGKSESVDAQARQLTKAGCERVFPDVHLSGARTDSAQLRRLARSARDLLNTLATITNRTGEGRERAKAPGVRLGRKSKLTVHQQQEARRRHDDREPIRDIVRSLNVSHSTISRL
jgi:DNA invertase Pin-like site-specific DNA recombinase